ncbi:hypothetical protein ORV05_23175 [Amycolatopsis cynarae]|uniref:Uncharacterized protein n=1 Tax=Amycolatopsis cynarae TaxID=2995223 RepID=A0ABY7AVZ8_9PSEU|nr:hypothetical protein [Amycolatopsis sp. HUAS 11-8]WAL63884.1 hypothetical protein ORV05_23175 [Amycolatopsis sp. HUAS 11-8]
MGTREALDALVRAWDDVRSRLSAEELAQVEGMVRELAAEGLPAALTKRSADLARYLARRLPADHPVRRALADGGTRLTGPAREARELTGWFATRDSLRSALLGNRTPTAEEVRREATHWLLAAEALSEAEVRARGWDPAGEDLIRLDRDDGGSQWPAFQFGPGIIGRINRILDAAGDPWGAADWWLGEHARLGEAPVRLIGRVDDEVLTEAALDERAED